jgi:hypothetical protein
MQLESAFQQIHTRPRENPTGKVKEFCAKEILATKMTRDENHQGGFSGFPDRYNSSLASMLGRSASALGGNAFKARS